MAPRKEYIETDNARLQARPLYESFLSQKKLQQCNNQVEVVKLWNVWTWHFRSGSIWKGSLFLYTNYIVFKFVFFLCNFRKDYIIDMCSVDRNHILVKTYLVGGASERIIPGMTLTEVIKSAPALSFGG